MRLCAGRREAVDLIGVSAQGQRKEAGNGKEMLSIYWLPRRPNESRGGRRGSSKCPSAINCGQSALWTPQVPCREMRVSSRQGPRPAGGEPSCPPARRRKAGKGNMVKYAKGVPRGCRWKWTVNKARWRTTEPEEVKLSSLRCSHWQ
jgi:hypothetical protein